MLQKKISLKINVCKMLIKYDANKTYHLLLITYHYLSTNSHIYYSNKKNYLNRLLILLVKTVRL